VSADLTTKRCGGFMTVRFVPREPPPPPPPERVLWRLTGVRLRVVCLAREYAHGTDLLLFQGDELVRSCLIRAGTAAVDVAAGSWKRALLEKGWTESAEEGQS
jgi:hypothetical protein